MPERRQRGIEPDCAARQLPLLRHRPMLNPTAAAFLIRSRNKCGVGIPIFPRRSQHRLRLRSDDLHLAITFELLAVAAIDQTPIVPRLGDERLEFAHAASASLVPTDEIAARPSISAAPAARAAPASTARSWPSSSSSSRIRPNT